MSWIKTLIITLAIAFSMPASAGDGADALNEVLSILSADETGSWDDAFESLTDQKLTYEAADVVATLNGESVEVYKGGEFIFGTTVYGKTTGKYSSELLVRTDDDGGNPPSTNSIIIIEEMGFIVIYFNNYVIIFY